MRISLDDRLHSNELEDTHRFRPVKIQRAVRKKLNSSLCIPSYIHSYSLCCSYMENWFVSKFPKDYFKTIYMEGKHALDEFRKYTPGEMVKRPKPSLSITPQPDWTFSNDTLNFPYGDANTNIRRTHNRDVFFRDPERQLYLGVVDDLMSITFNYKIRVNTRAKQVDLNRYMQNVLTTACTYGEYVEMDFHVPYDLMSMIASDVGFELDADNKIKNIIGFLGYLNSHSVVPFTYKLRFINGKNEFFIRMNQYIHFRFPDNIDLDDGERQGQISSNYILEYPVQVRFPCPRYYRYFSQQEHDKYTRFEEDGTMKAYYITYSKIPDLNKNKWPIYLTTDYLEDEDKLLAPLKINLEDLLKPSDLYNVIEFTKKQQLAPERFIDVQLYNDDHDELCRVNWDTYELSTLGIVRKQASRIVIYVDREYLNNQIMLYKEYYSNRNS